MWQLDGKWTYTQSLGWLGRCANLIAGWNQEVDQYEQGHSLKGESTDNAYFVSLVISRQQK